MRPLRRAVAKALTVFGNALWQGFFASQAALGMAVSASLDDTWAWLALIYGAGMLFAYGQANYRQGRRHERMIADRQLELLRRQVELREVHPELWLHMN